MNYMKHIVIADDERLQCEMLNQILKQKDPEIIVYMAANGQEAYEYLQRDGFIETTVGRGSFVSARNKEFYQEEQQRIAEEHLQAAANIGRVSNIPLSKLTELLTMFYMEDE